MGWSSRCSSGGGQWRVALRDAGFAHGSLGPVWLFTLRYVTPLLVLLVLLHSLGVLLETRGR